MSELLQQSKDKGSDGEMQTAEQMVAALYKEYSI